MPSILFHELIGYRLAKKHNEFDNKNFYLGAMVPDAVNAYGFANREDRWTAHYRDKDLSKWQNNIINFYEENKKRYESSYLTGYLVHVLTDIICDKIYQEELYPELIAQGYTYDSAYEYYRAGIEQFEDSNLNTDWWEYAKKSFQEGEQIPINNISKQMIADWVKYTIQNYQKRTFEEAGYITDNFADKVLEKVEEIILNV